MSFLHVNGYRPTQSRWPFYGVEELLLSVSLGPGGWMPSRPVWACIPSFRGRLIAAWAVLCGRAAAVEWK